MKINQTDEMDPIKFHMYFIPFIFDLPFFFIIINIFVPLFSKSLKYIRCFPIVEVINIGRFVSSDRCNVRYSVYFELIGYLSLNVKVKKMVKHIVLEAVTCG